MTDAAAGGLKSSRPRSRPGRAAADQRSRLLDSLVETVVRDGYPDAKVGDIADGARVSRATFYALFEGKEECLLTAQGELAARLGENLEAAVEDGEPAFAAQSAVKALVAFAEREPQVFGFLTHEAMLAGPAAQRQRDRLIERLEDAVLRAWRRAPEPATIFDLSPRLLLEGTIRMLDLHTRLDNDPPVSLRDDLLLWVDSYEVSAGPAQWRELTPHPGLVGASPRRTKSGVPQRTLPKGRHRLSPEIVSSIQRERIAHATAEAIRTKGFANATVADIVSLAGLSREGFYTHFADKEQAVVAAGQLVFEQLLASMGGAFFGSELSWPEQLWEAGLAMASFLEGDDGLAYFLSVATYPRPAYIERVHKFLQAFSPLVEVGNRYRPEASPMPQVVSHVLVSSVLEIVNLQIRNDRIHELRGLFPVLNYTICAPFMGTARATEFAQARLSAELAGPRPLRT